MDHADARGKRVKRRGEIDLLPVYEHVAAVAARFPDNVHSEKNLHEGAFTGTVFPDKTENLARLQREVDIREDLVAEKVLLDVFHLQQRSCSVYHISQILL